MDRCFSSSAESSGQRKRGEKGKLKEKKEKPCQGRQGRGFKMERHVDSVTYFREASETKPHPLDKASVILKESSYGGATVGRWV